MPHGAALEISKNQGALTLTHTAKCDMKESQLVPEGGFASPLGHLRATLQAARTVVFQVAG